MVTRLKPGLFILVPFELGHEQDYLGSPYVVARELVGSADYYVSHASAMDLHQMVTQPQLVVYTMTAAAIRPRIVLGTEFRFVRCKPKHLFGIVDNWVTKTERVRVSDPERTVVDGLKQSAYCGGFTEVAKGFLMRRDDLDPFAAYRSLCSGQFEPTIPESVHEDAGGERVVEFPIPEDVPTRRQ